MESAQEPLSCSLPTDGAAVEACYSSTGDRLATATADGAVHVFASAPGDGGQWRPLHHQQVGSSPTALAWADPEFGSLLAVGTSDGSTHMLAGPGAAGAGGAGGGGWRLCGSARGGGGSGGGGVCALAFAPQQWGLLLAVAGGDGCVWVHEGAGGGGDGGGRWEWTLLSQIKACTSGPCHALTWRHFTPGLPPMLLASSDEGAAVWVYLQARMRWQRAASLPAPGGEAKPSPARALHWAPTLGRPSELVAAAFGPSVAVFRMAGDAATPRVTPVDTLRHPSGVWRVAFSGTGMALACSLEGAPEVWVWMPNFGGGPWAAVSRVCGGGGGAELGGGAAGGMDEDVE